MPPTLRHSRSDWVAYMRRCHEHDEQERREGDRFGSSSIIPFGAVRSWGEAEARRVERAVSRPVPARIVDSGEEGVCVVVECPYCRLWHEYVFLEPPSGLVDALCGRGRYELEIWAAEIIC